MKTVVTCHCLNQPKKFDKNSKAKEYVQKNHSSCRRTTIRKTTMPYLIKDNNPVPGGQNP